MKKWATIWVNGEDSIADALNKLESGKAAVTIFAIIYIRYSANGQTGYRIVYYYTDVKGGK
jgi:hypothetical protein